MAKQLNPMRRSYLAEGKTEGWVAHRLEMMVSPAWRHRPVPLMRMLERIEIEHLHHGGAENGNLIVTYDQFVEWGVSRRAIHGLLVLGVRLGLLEVRQSGEWANDIRAPNTYRLTYLPESGGRRAPTDEWRDVSNEGALAAVDAFKKTVSGKTDSQFPNLQSASAHSCTEPTPASAHSCNSPVTKRELLYKSGGDTASATPELAASLQKQIKNKTLSREARSADKAEVQVSPGLMAMLKGKPQAPSLPEPSGTATGAELSEGERTLLRWLVGFGEPVSHRKAQQNLSGQMKGGDIREAAIALEAKSLVDIENSGRGQIYHLLDAGRDPALLGDRNQLDLEHWLETT